MRIAAFYSDSPFAGWVQCEGFVDILKRMGHEVVSVAVPPVSQITKAEAERINKPLDDVDMVMVSGPEHLAKWIKAFYSNWDKLKCAKVGWYHESFVREDYTLNYADYEGMFTHHFFPDKADAEKYKGEWLPLGVDTGMFSPEDENGSVVERDIDVGFIGLMYPKRARFVEELKPHLGNIKIQMRYGCQSERGIVPAVAVYDFNGMNIRRSMELLAETYRRIKVFVTFPSLSNVLVAKVLESVACGCHLVCPKQPVYMRANCFEYEGAYQCAQQIKEALKMRQTAAHDAAQWVSQEHRMELRFEKIFSKVGVCASV